VSLHLCWLEKSYRYRYFQISNTGIDIGNRKKYQYLFKLQLGASTSCSVGRSVGRLVGRSVGLSVCLANKNSKQKFSNKISKQNFHTKFSKEISKQISKGNFRTKFPNKHPNKISKQNFQNKFSNKISKRNLQTNLPKVAFKMNRKLLVIFRGGLQTVVILLIWVSQPTPPGFEQ